MICYQVYKRQTRLYSLLSVLLNSDFKEIITIFGNSHKFHRWALALLVLGVMDKTAKTEGSPSAYSLRHNSELFFLVDHTKFSTNNV